MTSWSLMMRKGTRIPGPSCRRQSHVGGLEAVGWCRGWKNSASIDGSAYGREDGYLNAVDVARLFESCWLLWWGVLLKIVCPKYVQLCASTHDGVLWLSHMFVRRDILMVVDSILWSGDFKMSVEMSIRMSDRFDSSIDWINLGFQVSRIASPKLIQW